ncbi:MAG: hypothetical protein V2I56_11615 [Desulfobacteraceae bacterium]|jgi:hypothetical protein|nr:hypothetical protein [Desulfobacteraceae bacterium]
MNEHANVVIYDPWPYITMVGVLEMMFTALGEGIQIGRLLFVESREQWAILQKNCPLTVYFQKVVQDLVIVLGIKLS